MRKWSSLLCLPLYYYTHSLISACSQGTDVFLGFWPFGNALCKAVVSIDYYNMFTSTFTLTVMSMDRYVAVCHPVKALDMRTPHKAKVTVFHFKVRYSHSFRC